MLIITFTLGALAKLGASKEMDVIAKGWCRLDGGVILKPTAVNYKKDKPLNRCRHAVFCDSLPAYKQYDLTQALTL